MSTSTLVSAGTLALSLLFPFAATAHTSSEWYDAHERYSWDEVTTKRFGRTLPSYGHLQQLRSVGGGVSIRVSAPSNWVMRGDTISYNLYIHNDDARTHTVQVRAALDPETWAISTSDNARVLGELVTWDNVKIPANASKTFGLQVRVNPGAPLTRQIRLMAYLPGSSDSLETELREMEYGDALPYYYSYDARRPSAYPSPTFGKNVYFHPPMDRAEYRNMFFGYVPAGPELPCDSRFMRCY